MKRRQMVETVERLDDPKHAQAFVWTTKQKSTSYNKERWNLLSKHGVIQSNNKKDAGRTFQALAKEKRRKKDILKFQVGLKWITKKI